VAKNVAEFAATGRRKEAVARVRIALGVGKRVVNGLPIEDYFKTLPLRARVEQPLLATESAEKYDVIVRVRGGGKAGQAGAVRHGIARALILADESTRQTLKSGGFLTRDARMKERKKPGQPGARKRFQFSKR
jgi:small subunit ribosomal protein S9